MFQCNGTQITQQFSTKLLDLSSVSWTEPHGGVIFKVIVMAFSCFLTPTICIHCLKKSLQFDAYKGIITRLSFCICFLKTAG